MLASQETKITMDFQGTDLTVFLQWYANLTNKKIIYGDLRQGQRKIYLIAPGPVPAKSVEKICLSVLERNGLTLVRVGRGTSEVYEAVEASQVASRPIAVYSAEQLKEIDGGDYVSQLLLIKYLKVANIVPRCGRRNYSMNVAAVWSKSKARMP